MITCDEFSVNPLSLDIKDETIIKDKHGGKRVKIIYKNRPLLIKQEELLEVSLKAPNKYQSNNNYFRPTLSIKLPKNSKLFEVIEKIENKLRVLLLNNKISSMLGINLEHQIDSIIKNNKDGLHYIYPKLKCQFNKKDGKIESLFTKFINLSTNRIIKISRYLNGMDTFNQKAQIVLHFGNLYITPLNKIWLQFYVSECYVQFEDENIIDYSNIKKYEKTQKNFSSIFNFSGNIGYFLLLCCVLVVIAMRFTQ